MKMKSTLILMLLTLALFLALAAAAQTTNGAAQTANGKDEGTVATANQATHDDAMRFEGEKRFRSNCGRCHTAPPKFPPRMMTTIVRHMRVRATITEKDMRLILRYMTQ
jgi:mono/diheme cytochrome c family protein